jgi:PLD-like domain
VSQRVIRRAANQSRVAVADLLEALMVAELLAPPSRLLLISPWISDFPVIDNRDGQFTHLDAQWGAARIRLSAVLRSFLVRGTRVYIACRSGSREDEFVNRLQGVAEADGTDSFLAFQRAEDKLRDRSHEKALVADSWALHGSMNFTYSGVELNGELVTFTDDPPAVAELATELLPLFGGPGG